MTATATAMTGGPGSFSPHHHHQQHQHLPSPWQQQAPPAYYYPAAHNHGFPAPGAAAPNPSAVPYARRHYNIDNPYSAMMKAGNAATYGPAAVVGAPYAMPPPCWLPPPPMTREEVKAAAADIARRMEEESVKTPHSHCRDRRGDPDPGPDDCATGTGGRGRGRSSQAASCAAPSPNPISVGGAASGGNDAIPPSLRNGRKRARDSGSDGGDCIRGGRIGNRCGKEEEKKEGGERRQRRRRQEKGCGDGGGGQWGWMSKAFGNDRMNDDGDGDRASQKDDDVGSANDGIDKSVDDGTGDGGCDWSEVWNSIRAGNKPAGKKGMDPIRRKINGRQQQQARRISVTAAAADVGARRGGSSRTQSPRLKSNKEPLSHPLQSPTTAEGTQHVRAGIARATAEVVDMTGSAKTCASCCLQWERSEFSKSQWKETATGHCSGCTQIQTQKQIKTGTSGVRSIRRENCTDCHQAKDEGGYLPEEWKKEGGKRSCTACRSRVAVDRAKQRGLHVDLTKEQQRRKRMHRDDTQAIDQSIEEVEVDEGKSTNSGSDRSINVPSARRGGVASRMHSMDPRRQIVDRQQQSRTQMETQTQTMTGASSFGIIQLEKCFDCHQAKDEGGYLPKEWKKEGGRRTCIACWAGAAVARAKEQGLDLPQEQETQKRKDRDDTPAIDQNVANADKGAKSTNAEVEVDEGKSAESVGDRSTNDPTTRRGGVTSRMHSMDPRRQIDDSKQPSRTQMETQKQIKTGTSGIRSIRREKCFDCHQAKDEGGYLPEEWKKEGGRRTCIACWSRVAMVRAKKEGLHIDLPQEQQRRKRKPRDGLDLPQQQETRKCKDGDDTPSIDQSNETKEMNGSDKDMSANKRAEKEVSTKRKSANVAGAGAKSTNAEVGVDEGKSADSVSDRNVVDPTISGTTECMPPRLARRKRFRPSLCAPPARKPAVPMATRAKKKRETCLKWTLPTRAAKTSVSTQGSGGRGTNHKPGRDALRERLEKSANGQEELLRKAAARVRSFLRFQADGPGQAHLHRTVFSRPVEDLSTLPVNHWRWPDPYARLGLPPGSGQALVKKHFRKLALLCHPDKARGDSLAPSRFHAVREAYEKLSRKP